jgi:uncharacterized protein (DUF1697 family)
MIYSVFLRGINTGGLKLKNEDFGQILSKVGCIKVKPIQAAGTAVFEFEGLDKSGIQLKIEEELYGFMGKDITAIIRTKDEINKVIDTVLPMKSSEEYHDYIMFTDDSDLFKEAVLAHEPMSYSTGEKLLDGMGYFIWTIKKGDTLNEYGSKILGSSKFKKRLTSRNLNTVQKVAAAMNKIEKEKENN